MATFAELYCQHYRVRSERFADSMFWRCLHRRTWPLVPLLKFLAPDYFSPDYDLIRDVGRLTRATGFTEDLADYHSHPMNVGFLRRQLRLRISVRLVTREVHRLLPGRAPAAFYESAGELNETHEVRPGPHQPPHSASS